MVERDDEDLWFECLAFAVEEFTPKNHTNRVQRALVLADRIYDACKAKTAKTVEAQKKLAPVVQMKS
jgi:hypothetical protein